MCNKNSFYKKKAREKRLSTGSMVKPYDAMEQNILDFIRSQGEGQEVVWGEGLQEVGEGRGGRRIQLLINPLYMSWNLKNL